MEVAKVKRKEHFAFILRPLKLPIFLPNLSANFILFNITAYDIWAANLNVISN